MWLGVGDVTHQTYQRLRSQYEAIQPRDVVRLKTFEQENVRWKHLLIKKGPANHIHRTVRVLDVWVGIQWLPARNGSQGRTSLHVARGPRLNHRRAIDFQLDETVDGRPVNILKVTKEFTREGQGTDASRWTTAAGMKAVRYLVVNNSRNRSSLCMGNRAESAPALCVKTVQKSISMLVTANQAHHGRTVTRKSSHDPQKNYRAEHGLI